MCSPWLHSGHVSFLTHLFLQCRDFVNRRHLPTVSSSPCDQGSSVRKSLVWIVGLTLCHGRKALKWWNILYWGAFSWYKDWAECFWCLCIMNGTLSSTVWTYWLVIVLTLKLLVKRSSSKLDKEHYSTSTTVRDHKPLRHIDCISYNILLTMLFDIPGDKSYKVSESVWLDYRIT